MTLIKFKNEAPARTLFPNTVDLFNEFFNDYTGSEFRKWNAPAVNIIENENAFKLQLAVPGLKKEDFKIALEENTLVVSAENKFESNTQTEKFTRKEFSFSSFVRRFNLPEQVKKSDITASYENGIMQITLPKTTEVKEKTREISIG